MQWRIARLGVAAVWCGLALWATSAGATPDGGVRVGFVVDGPVARTQVIEIFRRELVELLGDEFGLTVPESAIIPSDYTVEGVRASLDRLYRDPSIDIVVALGPLATQEAAHRSQHPKPTFAPFPVDIEMQGLPYRDGTSGVPNFNYLAASVDAGRSFEAFRELVPFDHLAMLVSAELARAIPSFEQQVKEAAREAGAELDVIRVGASPRAALDAIGPDVDAVFVTPLLHLYEGDGFRQLVDGLLAKRLPTFSLIGEGEVALGILAGVRPQSAWQRIARRIALNTQRTLLGEDPGSFPVDFNTREQLVINMATARAIGFSPTWSVFVEARLLHPDVEHTRELTLRGSVDESVAANLTLAANYHEVLAGAEEIKNARANLLPQAQFNASYNQVDSDRASHSFGLLPERQQDVGGRLDQLLFDEKVWGNLTVQKHLQTAREANRESLRLDITRDTSTAFLDVLRAQALLRIQRDNLQVSRSNLGIARVRVGVGYSGRQELLRWEAQIARDKQAVIDAHVSVQVARQTLNQLLDRPIEEGFDARDATLDAYGFVFGKPELRRFVDSPAENQIFRDFMVREGLAASPDLQRIDATLEAQERVHDTTRRAFYAPRVGFRADVRRKLYEGGKGANTSLNNDTDWNLGVRLTFPLLRGGARFSENQQAYEQVAQLRLERRSAALQTEQNIRSAFYVAAGSYTNIALSRDAAVASGENFELVSDLYARGVTGILDSLDAQNAALRSEEAAANAVYDFLVDLMRADRAASIYPFLETDADRAALIERMKAYFERATPRTQP